jgi:hypothetical protein
MRIRTSRKAIYVSMAVAMVALVGGFAAASVQLGSQTHSYQGSVTTTVGSVTGLSGGNTSFGMLETNVTNTTCSALDPCSVTDAGATDCVGGVPDHTGCLAGDFVEQVTFNTAVDTPFPGSPPETLAITMYVTNSTGTLSGTTFYYTQTSATNANSETIVQYFDTGSSASGPAPVTSVTVIITS